MPRNADSVARPRPLVSPVLKKRPSTSRTPLSKQPPKQNVETQAAVVGHLFRLPEKLAIKERSAALGLRTICKDLRTLAILDGLAWMISAALQTLARLMSLRCRRGAGGLIWPSISWLNGQPIYRASFGGLRTGNDERSGCGARAYPVAPGLGNLRNVSPTLRPSAIRFPKSAITQSRSG
jgi:hypothetical protein